MSLLPNPKVEPQFKAKVLSSERLTPDHEKEVRELTICVDHPNFTCKVNHSFGVVVEPYHAGDSTHHRLYSISDTPDNVSSSCAFKCLVKRCNYIDSFSGEEVQGVVSNYLCDRKSGDEITVTGPYPLPFDIPENPNANLILIGCGTGIAPFRPFIRNLYVVRNKWYGQIRLFYGSRNGLELMYINNKDQDRTKYYDEVTYDALNELSPKPFWMDSFTDNKNADQRAEELLDMLWESETYVYLAGHKRIIENLQVALASVLGSKTRWAVRKEELVKIGRWVEVIY